MMTNGQYKSPHKSDSPPHQRHICNSLAMNPNMNFTTFASAAEDSVHTRAVAIFTG